MLENNHVQESSRKLRLLAVGSVCLLLWIGILIVSSTSQASSYLSPSLAPCPSWGVDNTPNEGNLGNVLTSISVVSTNEVWAAGYTVIEQLNPGVREKTLVMRWDGAQWQIVPTPNPDSFSNYLNSIIAFSANDVWVSGTSGRNEAPVPFLLHWNGQQWSSATLPALDPSGNELYALGGSGPNDIWAVGAVGCISCKTEHSLVMHYNGTDWQTVPVVVSNVADALFSVMAISPTEAWFAGYQYDEFRTLPSALRWTSASGFERTEFPRMGQSQRGLLTGIAPVSSSDVWAAGYSYTPGPNQRNHSLIYHYDGHYWFNLESQLPNPSEEGSVLNAISANGPADVWAVGYFVASGVPRALVMHYNGSHWEQIDAPNPGERANLYGVSVTSNGDFFAAGYQVAKLNSDPPATLVERYVDMCAVEPTSVPTATTPANTATPVASVQIPGSNSRTFDETGKTVEGIFLDYWEKNGGLAQQGYPISEVLGELSPLDGKAYTVQYFERAVFEYHPENQSPYNVLLSQLGTFRYKQKYPTGAPGQSANNSVGSQLFTETGKRVGGKFLDYWQKNGGLTQQGYAISDEFQEVSDLDGKTYTVQYFERAVFEMHPENQPPYEVLLSQLGTFQYKETHQPGSGASAPVPAVTPTSPPASGQTPTAAAQGPCDNIPAGDPGIHYAPGQCVEKGNALTITLANISGPQVSVSIYGPDSESPYGQPFKITSHGGNTFTLGTSDSYEPGLYRMVIHDLITNQSAVGYFKTYP